MRDGLEEIYKEVTRRNVPPPAEAFTSWLYTQLCFPTSPSVAFDALVCQPFAAIALQALERELQHASMLTRDQIGVVLKRFQEHVSKRIEAFRGLQLFMATVSSEVRVDEKQGVVQLLSANQVVDSVPLVRTAKAPSGYLYTMLRRYASLGGENTQRAMPPAVVQVLQKDLHVDTELFVSPLKASFKHFYSPFFDTDWPFGSLGPTFSIGFLYGAYVVNPPRIPEFLDRVADFLFYHLDQSEKNEGFVRFFVLLPDPGQPVPRYIQLLKRCKYDKGHVYLPKQRKTDPDILGIWLESGRAPLDMEVDYAAPALRALSLAFA